MRVLMSADAVGGIWAYAGGVTTAWTLWIASRGTTVIAWGSVSASPEAIQTFTLSPLALTEAV